MDSILFLNSSTQDLGPDILIVLEEGRGTIFIPPSSFVIWSIV